MMAKAKNIKTEPNDRYMYLTVGLNVSTKSYEPIE